MTKVMAVELLLTTARRDKLFLEEALAKAEVKKIFIRRASPSIIDLQTWYDGYKAGQSHA